MKPTPAVIASRINSALDSASYGGAMPSRMRFDLDGCSVVVRARLGHLSVVVSASDGETVIESKGGLFSIADKAGNYASASALAVATALASSLNLDCGRM